MAAKVDPSDPGVRRLVYNMYRGMLRNYNDQANTIVDTLPRERVREDQGVARQLEEMIRQSSQLSGSGTPTPGAPTDTPGDGTAVSSAPAFPPAPPPPPPPGPGSLPTVRLSTEIPDTRGKPREPPAAIQNAMMTKDKKPFTYTPGGLDLSQIRSPGMQRRLTRNANSEGVGDQPQGGPRPTSLGPGSLPPSALAAMQPQLPVAVFPTGPPQPPPPPTPAMAVPKKTVTRSPSNPSPVPVQTAPQPPPPPPAASEPGSLYVPPVTSRSQVGSLYIPPLSGTSAPPPPQPQSQPQSASPGSPLPYVNLQKAPTPWLGQKQQQQQQQQQVPAWVTRPEEPPQSQQEQQPGTRIIPIQVEGREPPKQVSPQQQKQEQQGANTRIIPIVMEGSMQPQQHQQQNQYQHQQFQPQHQQFQPQHHYQPQQYVPPQQQQQQHPPQQRRPVYVYNKFNPPASPQSPTATHSSPDCTSPHQGQQPTWGPSGGAPIQSRSFRVLQKITDTDNNGPTEVDGAPTQQMRKLQLTEEDRDLMNKFKAQVDDEHYLHNESDPRYRGPSIPSRAFRMLQTMTDTAGDYVPQSGGTQGRQSRPVSSQFASGGEESPQPYVPPSEQQVAEPRKYTGGAIPSRSFRILQAMTASPEDTASDTAPNSHVDYSEAGPQSWDQYPSHYPVPPYWSTHEGWWGYYPSPDMEGQPPPPYWDPYSYSAMCAYMAEMNAAYGYPPMPYPPMYSPNHFASPVRRKHCPNGSSDSDEYSGYSSTDEMTYYGANFARNAAMASRSTITPNIIVTPSVPDEKMVVRESVDETPTPETKEEDETSGSDTEVEENNSDRRLKAIRSVSDISIYKSGSNELSPSSDVNDETEHEEETEEEDDEDEENFEEVQNLCEDQLPHQLSVIFEESEFSDACTKHDEDSSTATLDESDTDVDVAETPSSTVTVCLPLKLKFSRSENNEDVTTVIVGDSQVKCLESGDLNCKPLPCEAECHSRTQQDVSVTIAFPSRNISGSKVDKQQAEAAALTTSDSSNHTTREVSVSDLDCYETAESDSDVSVCLSLPLHKHSQSSASPMGVPNSNRATPTSSRGTPTNNRDTPTSTIVEEDEKIQVEGSDSPVSHGEDDSSSTTSVQTVKLVSEPDSKAKNDTNVVTIRNTDDIAEEESSSSDEDEEGESEDESSSSSSTSSFIENEEAIQKEDHGDVEPPDATEIFVQKVFDMCTRESGESTEIKTTGEESEEDDSGVTSDMSRQISDADTEPDDASKLTRYQRASTHSRLFKLLQEECEKSDDEDEEKEKEKVKDKPGRREQLSLPLHTLSDPDSLSSSSGVGSPASPTISDRLVKELVHSLLQRKKGKRLKKLPFAKLHAAALRVLQEDMDPYDTGSSATSEECSPVRHPEETIQPNSAAYGANYYDYCDYYNSWANAASYYGGDPTYEYDIVPSRAFKLLQRRLVPGSASGSWAKCPRISGPAVAQGEGEGRVTSETESQDHACAT